MTDGTEDDAIEVRIETFEAMHMACIRNVGPRSQVGPCFRALFLWAESVQAPTGRLLTLSFHRPDAERPRRWYWKAGVELFTHALPTPGIVLETLGMGRYAVHHLVGPHKGIPEAYRRLFQEWLPGSGEVVAKRPCMELYRNTLREVPESRLITDLCVPLREPGAG